MGRSVKAVGRREVLTLKGSRLVVELKWWMGWRNTRDGKRPPRAVILPVGDVEAAEVQWPRWYALGRLAITAPGHKNPWVRSRWWTRADRFVVKFGARREQQFEDLIVALTGGPDE